MGFGRGLGILIRLMYHSCDARIDVRGVVEGAGSLTQKVKETHLGRGSGRIFLFHHDQGRERKRALSNA